MKDGLPVLKARTKRITIKSRSRIRTESYRSFLRSHLITPSSLATSFTLYTPKTAAIIQRFLENKAVFDSDSPTGFSKWNPDTSRMEPFRHRINLGRETTAPVNVSAKRNSRH